MRDLLGVVFAVLMCSSGLVPAAYACTIGVNSVQANESPEIPKSAVEGIVRFRLVQSGCPSGATLTVAVLAIDLTGTIQVTKWASKNPVLVTLPAGGIPTDWNSVAFSYSGSGTVKFLVSVIACAKPGDPFQTCESLEWDVTPNSVSTGPTLLP